MGDDQHMMQPNLTRLRLVNAEIHTHTHSHGRKKHTFLDNYLCAHNNLTADNIILHQNQHSYLRHHSNKKKCSAPSATNLKVIGHDRYILTLLKMLKY